MSPACIECTRSGLESQEESVPVVKILYQYTRTSTDEGSKVDSTGLFFYFFQVRANKYRYLSWSIGRSDPEVDDDLRVGAAPDIEEDRSPAHFCSRDQVTLEPA